MDNHKYYEQALAEVAAGNRDAALDAKAYTIARGNVEAQKFEYIELRVAQLQAEHGTSTEGTRDTGDAAAILSSIRNTGSFIRKAGIVALWLFGLYFGVMMLYLLVLMFMSKS